MGTARGMDTSAARSVSFRPAALPPMRAAALSLVLVACLAVPSLAQPLVGGPERSPAVAPARLSPSGLFNSQTLRFSQSVEMTYSGGAGGSLGLGTYTGSLQWQPSARLAGRVDLAVAQPLFGSGAVGNAFGAGGGLGSAQPSVYLRNAEIAYRPTANSVLHLSVQQSPYGAYASPYGYASPYAAPYGVQRMGARWGTDGADRLFFRDAGR